MTTHEATGLVDRGIEATENPAVGQRQIALRARRTFLVEPDVVLVNRAESKARGVPELVSKVAGVFDALNIELEIDAGRTLRDHGEAQRVGAIVGGDERRIDD